MKDRLGHTHSWQFVLTRAPTSVCFEDLTVCITHAFCIKAAEQVLLCLKGKLKKKKKRP